MPFPLIVGFAITQASTETRQQKCEKGLEWQTSMSTASGSADLETEPQAPRFSRRQTATRSFLPGAYDNEGSFFPEEIWMHNHLAQLHA